MKVNHMNRLLLGLFVGTVVAGFGSSVLAQPQLKGKYEQSDNDKKDKQDEEKQGKNQQRKPVEKPLAEKPAAQPVSQLPRIEQAERKQENRMQAQTSRQKIEREKTARDNANRKQNDARLPITPAPANRNQDARQRIAEAKDENRSKAPGNSKDQRRLPAQQQRVLIVQQQQRVTQYRQNVAQRQNASRQHGMQLQQQKRMAQYNYQQQYYERMRQQQIRYQNERYDYNNDPYFYTASSYRYNRGGRYYETNQYGASILRQALNYGYQEGMRAGRADQQDHWRYSYRDSYIYEDANYGYNGYYVQQDDYNYYFRQGFQRGYEDGYYGRRKYGRNNNGSDSLLSAVLITVLGLQSIR
ncbi:MAG TPA: hypothetical protein PLF92_05345 [Arenimonas sp.]|nr:hypothetical protein [Arenimonas sp.]HPW32316.1 hypothetical protein [Arenimonas sp.]